MRRKKGRKGWMLLKLDLEKAYDRIRWDFLLDTLHAARLPEEWCNWIMTCVAGPTMTVLWNGEKTTPFTPARGLRQGDPLSPYLFVLCMERLCHLIGVSVAANAWKPISLSRGGPKLSHMCFADDLILFAEASVTQIRIIRGVLERFCGASGQKVSLDKSKIFFSKNVSRELAQTISAESGIKQTCDLGKYLGMPVLHKRINRTTFGPILERVESRLAGWRGRFLSMAGRVTLTKSVLASIPVHSMSTILLPSSLLDQLDRVARSFIWGTSTHLLAWDRVVLKKEQGGLGIRQAHQMNKALIAKVGWRLLKESDSLWARVIIAKYKVGGVIGPSWLTVKSSWSATWKSIAIGLREVIFPNLSWVVGDGTMVRFWVDRWLLPQPLCEIAIGPIPVASLQSTVNELWRPLEGWDMPQIAPYVTEVTRLHLLSRVVCMASDRRDCLSWGANSSGKFSVKSAYGLLTANHVPQQQMGLFFTRIWSVLAPERVRLFLWLASHQVIMTNMERLRRHLSSTGVCQVCRGGYETILHVLRDCDAMKGIWMKLTPISKRAAFFSMSLLEWVYTNLGDMSVIGDCPWASLFAIALWWAWKWRCGNVFGVVGRCRDRVQFLKDQTVAVVRAHKPDCLVPSNRVREERMISWKFPDIGWYKVNTDGASRGNPGLATAGGVVRDDCGTWCGGFALNIGICSAPMAELWGVYYGLCIAWERGITRLVLEVDSELVVGFLQTGIDDSHPLSFLVHLCYGLLSKDWIVRVTHVYREANRLADGLANYAFSLPLGFHLFPTFPESVSSIVLEDVNGSAYPRMIRM